ncbi:MAG: sugar phosphorylase [Anaerolineaceae bacterium]|nr:sugar phosphorylase [Anaerolineaceae bacterium]
MHLTFYTTQLTRIYGKAIAEQVLPQLQLLVEKYRDRIPAPHDTSLNERDSILITYGDQINEADKPHLQTLLEFCETRLQNVVSGIHILPFYPWSSDDGFSVRDYRAVDPALGTWSHIERLGQSFRLMFDGVINHCSTQGEWFQAFIRDEAPYRDYFIVVEGNPDLSQVVRPRAMPLLTEFQTASGKRSVWTTFSIDQADLNYHNPAVLIEMIDILLMYAQRGAQFLRLDAIAYLWKEIGTPCIHLPQTHAIIQLLRAILDDLAPHVRLITETNVPHKENISYFGNGENEAQLVYNFALPPLVLHTFNTGDATILTKWASNLALPSKKTTFLNFLASHDGIGLNPVRGILGSDDIDALVEQTHAHGGLISFKQNADGSKSPYELNISYFDALSDPSGEESLDIQIARFMAAQAILLALRGLPGIYIHSLLGSRNWLEGYKHTGRARAINREKLVLESLESEIKRKGSLRQRVFSGYSQLLSARRTNPAFHPNGGQEILNLHESAFSILRISPDKKDSVICIQNVQCKSITIEINLQDFGLIQKHALKDLLSAKTYPVENGGRLSVRMGPYSVLWLAAELNSSMSDAR